MLQKHGIFVVLIASCLMVPMSDCLILDCEYRNVKWQIDTMHMYTCTATVISDGETKYVLNVTGNHKDGRNNSDVEALLIYGQNVQFAPRNIQMFFQNLKAFSLFNNSIEELTRECLSGLHTLRYFNFLYNRLEIIESDLFIDNNVLEWIDFGYNPIRHVGYQTFNHLHFLQILNFTLTTCINQSGTNSSTVELLKSDLFVKCPPTSEMTDTKIVNGTKLQNQIDKQNTERIDPLKIKLLEIEENEKPLERRIDILESAGNNED